LENTLYVALSRQMILRREMDVVANNIANADTPAFKVEMVLAETNPAALPTGPDAGSDMVQFTLDVGVGRDFTQGVMATTGRPFDLGIEGDGFFQINTADGERYTRDGRFTTNEQGQIVTARGDVLGAGITVDPLMGEVSISHDGVVSQQGVRIGKVDVFRFASLSGLSKTGDGLYRNDGNIAPETATDAKIQQGAVESSNVQPVIEITRMMEVAREYERIAKMMDQTAQLDRSAISRLGSVSTQ